MQTLGCSKKERKAGSAKDTSDAAARLPVYVRCCQDAQQDNLDRGDDSAKCIELPAGDFGSGPDVSMLPSSVFEKPKRVDEPGTEAEAPQRGDRPRSGVTSEGSEDEPQEHNQRSWWAQFFRLRLLQTPGAASLCVPLARMGLQDTGCLVPYTRVLRVHCLFAFFWAEPWFGTLGCRALTRTAGCFARRPLLDDSCKPLFCVMYELLLVSSPICWLLLDVYLSHLVALC